MSDDPSTPGGLPPDYRLKDIPEPYRTPPAVLSRWFELPPEHPVEAALVRRDIDNLLLTLIRLNDAVADVADALAFSTQGNVSDANKVFHNYKANSAIALNHLHAFMTSVMVGSLLPEPAPSLPGPEPAAHVEQEQ